MSCFNGIERPETVDGISIKWYESDIPYFRHVFLAEEGSEAGKLNAVYFNLIRNWIKEKTMDRKQTLLQIFKTYTKQILYRYLKSNADLKSSIDIDVKILSVNETNSLTIKKKTPIFIKVTTPQDQPLELLYDTISYEGFRFTLSRTVEFKPLYDIIHIPLGVIIIFDTPGFTQKSIDAVSGMNKITATYELNDEIEVIGSRALHYYNIEKKW